MCFVVLWELLEGAVALPFSAYRTFVIEARHGMNTQTAMTFVLDTIKSLLLLLLLAPPLVTLLVRVLRLGGPLMPLYAWGVVASLQVVMMTLYPVLIAPLFNKFAPLQSGSLKQAVEALASKVGFPLARLQVVDGSKRSAHSNAYMYGFWRSKRIVLYDTLLSQLTESEVVAVLAHELGHWKLGHTLKMTLVGQAVLVAQLLAYTLVRDWADLYRAFGFEDFRQGDAMPVLVGLVLFQHLLIPLALPLTLVTNGASRRHEFQADDFAASMGMGPQLRSSLLVLQEENLSTGVVDPWFAWFAYRCVCKGGRSALRGVLISLKAGVDGSTYLNTDSNTRASAMWQPPGATRALARNQARRDEVQQARLGEDITTHDFFVRNGHIIARARAKRVPGCIFLRDAARAIHGCRQRWRGWRAGLGTPRRAPLHGAHRAGGTDSNRLCRNPQYVNTVHLPLLCADSLPALARGRAAESHLHPCARAAAAIAAPRGSRAQRSL